MVEASIEVVEDSTEAVEASMEASILKTNDAEDRMGLVRGLIKYGSVGVWVIPAPLAYQPVHYYVLVLQTYQ